MPQSVPYQLPPHRWEWANYSSLPLQRLPSLKSSINHFLKFSNHILPQKDYEDTVNLAEWWLDEAYLLSRFPLPVNVTPGLSFPTQHFKGISGQLDFAAHLVEAMLHFKHLIHIKALPTDMGGRDSMDMSQYDLIFGTCRIPGEKKDWLRYGSDTNHPVNHITVIRNGHIFEVPVYDGSFRPLSRDQIARQLNVVFQESESKCPYPMGLLTTAHRPLWAKIHSQMRSNRMNRWMLDRIEESLFVVCLDKAPRSLCGGMEGLSEREAFLKKQSEMGRQLLHGNGGRENGGNRWFDKTVQIIVGEGGICGLAYEHSPAEGPPIASLMDATMDYCVSGQRAPKADESTIKPPVKMNFALDKDTKAAIVQTSQQLDIVADDLQVNIFPFSKFGKGVPKSFKLSPDSFMQLALQLAYHRVHKDWAPTYETGTLRRFKLGRTDTIRLPNSESVAFVLGMEDAALPRPEKARLLRSAVAAHKAYTLQACSGEGMDRHLLGLKLMAKESGRAVPKLLEGPAYRALNHYKLSTSQVPAKQDGSMVFGPMYPDCYGVCYNPKEDKINLSVTAFNRCPDTDPFRFSNIQIGEGNRTELD